MRKVMTLNPCFWFPYFIVGHWRALEGPVDEALALVERGHQLAPWFLPLVGLLAVLLQRTGDTKRDALATRLQFEDGMGNPIGQASSRLHRGNATPAPTGREGARNVSRRCSFSCTPQRRSCNRRRDGRSSQR